jgi:hypothetical protein
MWYGEVIQGFEKELYRSFRVYITSNQEWAFRIWKIISLNMSKDSGSEMRARTSTDGMHTVAILMMAWSKHQRGCKLTLWNELEPMKGFLETGR